MNLTSLHQLRTANRSCTDCSLRSGCTQVVTGQLPSSDVLDRWEVGRGPRIMIVGEAPGYREDKSGLPFIGPSGNELDHYLPTLAGIPRSMCYVTNTVRCRPFNNSNPPTEATRACFKWLDGEINAIEPTHILALGAFACKWFLGSEFDIEKQHGIPVMWAGQGAVLFPTYHPAAGLHERDTLQYIQEDLRIFGEVVRGEYVPVVDEYPQPVYHLHKSYCGFPNPDDIDAPILQINQCAIRGLDAYLNSSTTITIDTEDAENGSVWCYSISAKPGTGVVIMGDDEEATNAVAWRLADKEVTTVMHYGMHDLPRLATLGIIPANYTDTIIKAYLLGNLPQRLKALAYRLCGMEMRDYMDMIHDVREGKVLGWLLEVSGKVWPDSPQEKVWSSEPKKEKQSETKWVKCTKRHKDAIPCPSCLVGEQNGVCALCGGSGFVRAETKTLTPTIVPGTERGYWRWKQPQNISVKVNRMLGDYFKKDTNDEPLDLVERWGNLSDSEREVVEAVMGRMPTAWLAEIPLDDAVHYSARDADATLRVNTQLDQRIKDMGLCDVLAVDTAIIPLLNEMMSNGMKVDIEHFETLSVYYQLQLDSLHQQISGLFPGEEEDILGLNLSSNDTLTWLLYDKCKLTPPSFTKTGRPSVAGDELSKLMREHAIIPLIIKLNETRKLKGTFADKLPRYADRNGRIHSRIKSTRTVTGRLAYSDPPLQQMPTRSEDGAMIRAGVIAPLGRVIVGADYVNIEMRYLCDESQDERMMQIFLDCLEGFEHYPEKVRTDMHTLNAAMFFNVDPLIVRATRENEMRYRYPGKTTGFGSVYGLTAEGLCNQMIAAGLYDFTVKDAERLLRMFLVELHPGVGLYFKKCDTEMMKYGYIRESCLGRIRRIPGVRSSLPWVVEASQREGRNMKIQGGAQGVLKLAMLKVDRESQYVHTPSTCGGKYKADWLLQFHDALYFEVDEDVVVEFSAELKGLMETAHQLSVPLPVEVHSGKNWAEC